jgi:hypothetical protein
MFRTVPVAEPTDDVEVPADLIPITHLGLDLPEPPVGGWVAYLTGRGIEVVTDDIGRLSISRADAKQLFDEHHQNELRKREMAAQLEAQAIERDQEFRAGLNKGIPWHHLPDGVTAAEAMAAADRETRPRRAPTQNEWLFGDPDTMVFHPINGESGDEQ